MVTIFVHSIFLPLLPIRLLAVLEIIINRSTWSIIRLHSWTRWTWWRLLMISCYVLTASLCFINMLENQQGYRVDIDQFIFFWFCLLIFLAELAARVALLNLADWTDHRSTLVFSQATACHAVLLDDCWCFFSFWSLVPLYAYNHSRSIDRYAISIVVGRGEDLLTALTNQKSSTICSGYIASNCGYTHVD